MKSRTPEPRTATPKIKQEERELAEVQRVVCEHYNLPRSSMITRDREEPLVTRRQLAMVLAREFVKVPLRTIAAAFAREDHNTIIHACVAIPNKMITDPALATTLNYLRTKTRDALEAIRTPKALASLK